MATTNLNNDSVSIVSGKDSVVVPLVIDTIPGGRSLNVTGFTPAVIQAGHVIIMETASKDYKPMPLNGGASAYASLPTGHEYVGILISSIPTKKAMAGIVTRGRVNPAAAPFSMSSILAAVKTALPLIDFRED